MINCSSSIGSGRRKTPVNLNRIDPLLDRLLAEHEEEIAEKDNALRLSTMTACRDLLRFVAALRFD